MKVQNKTVANAIFGKSMEFCQEKLLNNLFNMENLFKMLTNHICLIMMDLLELFPITNDLEVCL